MHPQVEQILATRGAPPDAPHTPFRSPQTGDALIFLRLTFDDVLLAETGQRLYTLVAWCVNCLIAAGQWLEMNLSRVLQLRRPSRLPNFIHAAIVIQGPHRAAFVVEAVWPGGVRVTPLAQRDLSKALHLPLKQRYRPYIRPQVGWQWLQENRRTRYNLLGLFRAIFPWLPLLLRLPLRILRACGVPLSFCSELVVRGEQFLGVLPTHIPGLGPMRRGKPRWVPLAEPIDPMQYSPCEIPTIPIFDTSEARWL